MTCLLVVCSVLDLVVGGRISRLRLLLCAPYDVRSEVESMCGIESGYPIVQFSILGAYNTIATRLDSVGKCA